MGLSLSTVGQQEKGTTGDPREMPMFSEFREGAHGFHASHLVGNLPKPYSEYPGLLGTLTTTGKPLEPTAPRPYAHLNQRLFSQMIGTRILDDLDRKKEGKLTPAEEIGLPVNLTLANTTGLGFGVQQFTLGANNEQVEKFMAGIGEGSATMWFRGESWKIASSQTQRRAILELAPDFVQVNWLQRLNPAWTRGCGVSVVRGCPLLQAGLRCKLENTTYQLDFMEGLSTQTGYVQTPTLSLTSRMKLSPEVTIWTQGRVQKRDAGLEPFTSLKLQYQPNRLFGGTLEVDQSETVTMSAHAEIVPGVVGTVWGSQKYGQPSRQGFSLTLNLDGIGAVFPLL